MPQATATLLPQEHSANLLRVQDIIDLAHEQLITGLSLLNTMIDEIERAAIAGGYASIVEGAGQLRWISTGLWANARPLDAASGRLGALRAGNG